MEDVGINNKEIIIPFQTGISFGSGSTHTELFVDGVRVDEALAKARGWNISTDDDGFVVWAFIHIPLDECRRVREIILDQDHYPGTGYRFQGSGASMIRRLVSLQQPWEVSPSLWSRLRDYKAEKFSALLEQTTGPVMGGTTVPRHCYAALKGRSYRLEEAPQGWIPGVGAVVVRIGGRVYCPDQHRMWRLIAKECSSVAKRQ